MNKGPRALVGIGGLALLGGGAYGAYRYERVDRPKYNAPPDDPRCPSGMAYIRGGVGHLLQDKILLSDEVPRIAILRNAPAPDPVVRDVKIDPFCMDWNEVTVADYDACVRAGECLPPGASDRKDLCNDGKLERAQHPINCVTWLNANHYCAVHGKRLPLEDEWEYAAQGGEAHYENPSGGRSSGSCMKVWTERDGTCAVRSFPPEAFGLFDLSGNVKEDVEFSCDGKSCPDSPSPSEPVMGCYWGCDEGDATEHTRTWAVPDDGWAGGGFRCAK
jgi:formylglycine-generating enzyme required for sulfatase activity